MNICFLIENLYIHPFYFWEWTFESNPWLVHPCHQATPPTSDWGKNKKKQQGKRINWWVFLRIWMILAYDVCNVGKIEKNAKKKTTNWGLKENSRLEREWLNNWQDALHSTNVATSYEKDNHLTKTSWKVLLLMDKILHHQGWWLPHYL